MNRFLCWLVLPVLVLSLAGTAQAANTSRLRSVSIGWGTWTPQGITGVSDTTYLTGATQTVDTTNSIATSDWDWFPLGRADLNGAIYPVFKIGIASAVSSGFVSVDSFTVTVQGSPNNATWVSLGSTALTSGVPTTYGNQQALSTVPLFKSTTGGDVYNNTQLCTPYPFYRFIITVDGNTAARMSGTRCYVSYYRVANDRPKLVWQKLSFLVSGDECASPSTAALKDTSTITFSAPDTSNRLETTDWAVSGDAVAPFAAADSTGYSFRMIALYTPAATMESLYVYQDGSFDGCHWASNAGTTAPFPPTTAVGTESGIWALGGDSGNSVSSGNMGGFPSAASKYQVTHIFGTPWVRFRFYGETSGEAPTGTQVWVGYWQVPKKGD